MKNILVIIFLSVGLGAFAFEQHAASFDPSGYWQGTIIKDNATFRIDLSIDKIDNGYSALTYYPEWIFYSPKERDSVTVTETGLRIADLIFGDATLQLEPKFGQLFGYIGKPEDNIKLHLKRASRPVESSTIEENVTFLSSDKTLLSGTVFRPQYSSGLPGMVIVRGRGCATRVKNKARFFAQYGMVVLTYDKRGSGASQGNCATFTLEELTEDAVAAFNYVQENSFVDSRKVGFLGVSAGAWTIQKATEILFNGTDKTKPAFLITWIGPSTSILQQQISSAFTYGQSVGLSHEQQKLLVKVSKIISDKTLDDDVAYSLLEPIRQKAENEGWLQTGFGPDDIPKQRSDMNQLWLRRFQYDPSQFLFSLESLPYLAIFGELDPIVQVEENVEALLGKGKDIVIRVIPESGHGFNINEQQITLKDETTVWIFEGPNTGFVNETIQFLRQRDFMTH